MLRIFFNLHMCSHCTSHSQLSMYLNSKAHQRLINLIFKFYNFLTGHI
jgi:hypothetical protein